MLASIEMSGVPKGQPPEEVHPSTPVQVVPVHSGRKTYHCQKARQPGGDLEISTIVDPLNPKIMLTETLAKIYQITVAPDHPAWSKTCGKLEACGGLKVTKRVSFRPLMAHTAQDMTKLKAF
jgi:hypothetical protein